MNAFKRFFLGFLAGIGIMYWFLHRSEATWQQAWSWLQKNASMYRADQLHDKAKEVLGDR